MKNLTSLQIWFLTALICVGLDASQAQTSPSEKPKQFIYVLHLVPRLYADGNWTKEDEAAVARHVTRFKDAMDKGELILAGRTPEPGDKTFGIAIFQAANETAARRFMESDPAVIAGVMTAELHPFAVAFERKH